MHLTWIIPTLNEERRIEKTLREVHAYLSSRAQSGLIADYDISVSDSDSKDGTVSIVERLKQEVPRLEIIHVENRGKGWAVKQGMLRAKGDVALFSDADNSTPPQYFDDMAPLFQKGYDLVISSRDPHDVPGATRDVQEPWHRELLGRMGNLVIQLFGVWGIYDTQNGFKAMTTLAAREIFMRSRIAGWAFDIEMLALARAFGYRIGIIPIRWRYDPDSKVTLKSYLQVLRDVFRIRLNLITGKYQTRLPQP